MAVDSSIGYDGTVKEDGWARLSNYVGQKYGVGGTDDWAVEAVTGLDRTVRIRAGEGFGHGVLDTTSTDQTLQLPTIASGSRWDLIAARRDWAPIDGTPGLTEFVYIEGTSAKALPAGMEKAPGIKDDQPCALVQVTAGQTLPTGILDLRWNAHKVITINSLRGVPDWYMEPGMVALAGNGFHPYRVDVADDGSLGWVPMPYFVSGKLTTVEFKNGYASVPHGLSFTPSAFVFTPSLATSSVTLALVHGSVPISANNVAIRAFNHDGTYFNGHIGRIDFIAAA